MEAAVKHETLKTKTHGALEVFYARKVNRGAWDETGTVSTGDRHLSGKNAQVPGLQDRAAQYLPGGSSRGTSYFDPYPHFIDHGEGYYVYDVDGNRYLDFMINATSLILGHAIQTWSRPFSSRLPRARPSAAPPRPRYGWPKSCAIVFPRWTGCASPTPAPRGP